MGAEAVPVPMDMSQADAAAGDGAGPKRELPALKVTFYELLVRQLQDDGFAAEAQSLSRQLHVEPDAKADKDSLFEAYARSLKWAFGGKPAGEWTPVVCSPVPPLGPQDRVLNLDADAEKPLGIGPAGRRPPEIRLLYTATHKQAVRTVAFANDGRSCATGCLDGTIKVLDCAKMRACAASTEGTIGRMRVTDEELQRPVQRMLQDHHLSVTCLAFHPMNATLFSGSMDKAVKIFDLTRPAGHKKAVSMLQDVHPVRSLAIHPCGDFLLVGTAHQAVRLYDLQTLTCFTSFDQAQHHGAGVNDIRCSGDGRVFATASSDGSIRLWDAVANRLINTVPKAHSGAVVTSLRWSRGLRYLLSSGADGRSRLWDVRTGQELFGMGFGPRSCDYSSAVFTVGERYVASANSNVKIADVSLFDARTGSPVFTKLSAHVLPVHALEASPVDNTLMTACDDHNARYFAVEDKGA